jgi:hypothetical protein
LLGCAVHERVGSVGQSEGDTLAELWCSNGSLASSQHSHFHVLILDVALRLDLALFGDSDVVHIEGVDAREQDTLVVADFEACCCNVFQPQVDELFTGLCVG